MPPIRVLLADDQALFREGLRMVLEAHPGIEVVGEAENGEDVVRLAASIEPEVVLMDLKMPVLDGVAATRRLKASLPRCRVIVLTTFDDDDSVFDALRAGAIGYLLKDVPSERLIEAIHLAVRGESFLQPAVAAKVVAEFARLPGRARLPAELASALSDREREVLQHVACGLSNKEIAVALHIAEGTVKNHMTSILEKLGVDDRTRAALKAREIGIL